MMQSMPTQPNPLRFKPSFNYGLKFSFCLAWLFIWCVVAIPLAVLGITIPIALGALWIGFYPARKLLHNRHKAVQAWRGDQPMDAEGEVPWEL